MSIEDLIESESRINELWEVVGIYELVLEGIEQKLKIKVKRFLSAESELYMGVPSLRVQQKGSPTPYANLGLYPTAEQALVGTIHGFFAFPLEDATILEVEDW